MSLLIKNGRIITSTDDYVADIHVADETITAIGHDLQVNDDSAEVIDATGKLVFPGFIDPHVHIYLPFMGTYAKDDYDSASRAALVGGTTTLIEMCCPSRADDPIEAFELWKSKAEGLAAVDYSFHMGVTRFDEKVEAQLRELVKRGLSSFKIFLAYQGAFGIDDEELFQILKASERVGRHRDGSLRERDRCVAATGRIDRRQATPAPSSTNPHAPRSLKRLAYNT